MIEAPDELEPCPFCGAVSLELKQPDGWLTAAWIECDKCGASGPPATDQQDAWESWNDRRAPARPFNDEGKGRLTA